MSCSTSQVRSLGLAEQLAEVNRQLKVVLGVFQRLRQTLDRQSSTPPQLTTMKAARQEVLVSRVNVTATQILAECPEWQGTEFRLSWDDIWGLVQAVGQTVVEAHDSTSLHLQVATTLFGQDS